MNIKDKRLRLCLYGKFDFNDQEIIQNTKKIIQSQRDFFNDYNFDNYLITVIETPVTVIETPEKNEKLASMGGIALRNSFAAYLSKGITKTQFKILLAHEHLHNWIGGVIRNAQEELNYWWSEGFTDYYARVLSTRYRSLSLDEFIAEVNDILKEYYSSPVINANNAKIKKEFWNSYDVYRQAYLRGFVFAVSLNCKIKRYAPNSSIDEILRYFHKNHKIIHFSNQNFIKALKETNIYTKEIEKYFEAKIITGKTISLEDCVCHLPIDQIKNPQQRNGFFYRINPKLNSRQKEQIINFFELN